MDANSQPSAKQEEHFDDDHPDSFNISLGEPFGSTGELQSPLESPSAKKSGQSQSSHAHRREQERLDNFQLPINGSELGGREGEDERGIDTEPPLRPKTSRSDDLDNNHHDINNTLNHRDNHPIPKLTSTTANPPTATSNNPIPSTHDHTSTTPDSPPAEAGPTDLLPAFDWDELEGRFHDEIARLHEEEDEEERGVESLLMVCAFLPPLSSFLNH